MKKKGAIFKKSAAIMSAMAVIQIAVFFGTAAASGIMSSINSGEEAGLTRSASRGGTYLRNEMLRKSAAVDGIIPALNEDAAKVIKDRNMSAEEFLKYTPAVNEYLEAASGDLLEFIRRYNADGAFIVVCNSAGEPDSSLPNSYRGVFFKDTDIYSAPDDYSDIMLLRGSSTVSSRYEIPLDMSWSGKFDYDASSDSMSYLFEPVKAAFRYPNESYDSLGFWSREFTVSGENKFDRYNVISYSVPLILDGQPYGAAGVCFTPENIMSLIPSEETEGSSTGYMLVTSERETSGSLTDMHIEAFRGSRFSTDMQRDLSLSKTKGSESIYCINDLHTGDRSEYCAAEEIDLYSDTSPYYDTRWLLLATEPENELFGASKRLESRLISAIIISAVIAVVLSVAAAKILFSPIEQLAEETEDINDGDIIPVNERSDYEIYVISKALNKLSESKNKYQNELDAERQRYITALQAVHSDIFEYDCLEDTFTIYRFSEEGEYGSESHSTHEHFRAMTENGVICPVEDIPAMLSFIEGKTEKHIEIRIFRQDGTLRWNDVNARVIRDQHGEPVKIIASSTDITDKKESELKRMDKERRDSITGLYKNEYGSILAEKNLLEKGKGDYTTVVVSLCGSDEFIRRYGVLCYNGALEEIGRTAYICKAKNDILWKISDSKIAAYIPEASSDKLWDRIEGFLSHVRTLYCADENDTDISCRIGVSLNKYDVSFHEAIGRAERAAIAAELKSSSLEYYNGDETELLVRGADRDLITEERESTEKDYIFTDNIITYVLTMLARTPNMRRSVNIVFRKAIRVLGLDRIAMFDISPEHNTLKLYTNCRVYGKKDYGVPDIPVTQDELAAIQELIASDEMIVADKHFYISSGKLLDLITKFREDGIFAILPITENFRPVGYLMFSCAEEKYTPELSETMRQLSKIVSAYVMRFRYVKETHAKTDLLGRMSEEIKTPVNEIIAAAENAIGNKSSDKDKEETLLAIKRSADNLSGLIDNIAAILENKS